VLWHCLNCFSIFIVTMSNWRKYVCKESTIESQVADNVLQFCWTNILRNCSCFSTDAGDTSGRAFTYDEFLSFRRQKGNERQAHFLPSKRQKKPRPVSVSFCNLSFYRFIFMKHAFCTCTSWLYGCVYLFLLFIDQLVTAFVLLHFFGCRME